MKFISEYSGLFLNVAGVCAAIFSPIFVFVLGIHNKVAIAAALTAIGYAILTIIGLILEWHNHYGDLNSDLFLFGFLTVLTGASGLGSLLGIKRKKSN